MSKSIRNSGPAISFAARVSALSIALVACATFAGAQTAPQLLPYTSVLVAGGAATNPAKGATCPVSGNTSLDAFGDGCLATEINVAPTTTSGTGARYAIADKTGAVFFSDATNGLVRRIDPVTGVVTVVAGGAASNPGSGTVCGTGVSTDANGDGCPANLVKISHPMGLAFDAAGNLYFADNGFDDVRKVAATGGVITTTGIISNIVGNISTFGYNVNNTSTTGPVNAATQSYLNFPYGIAFDSLGNLYIADEGNNALEVVNMTAATETLQGMSVPAGTIAKFAGYGSLAAKTATSGDCPDFVSTSARGGCYFGKWTDGSLANVSNVDGNYSVTLDSSNNVYFANEFNNDVGLITTGNVISNYAGIQATALKKNQRGVAGTFGIGSVFGVAMDALNNQYITDASSGYIWRVDATGKLMYVIAGGATTVCTNATDTYGDGCPATQATFGSSGTGSFASTTLPGPGIFGVNVDAFSDLFVGDTVTGLVRKIASGTQFGAVGANQPTNIVDIHFAAADSPVASGAYTLTAGATNFSLGTATCTTNSDNTTDCLLPVTATPTALGPFSGTLTVKAQLGGTANFPLSGTFVTSPLTRTTVTFSSGSTACGSTSSFGTTTPITLTATIGSTGSPTGTVTFFSNGTQIGTPQTVSNSVATLTTTFSTANTYIITATYSGDTYFKPSTGKSSSFSTSTPGFTTSIINSQTTAIVAGQTALYSFNVAQNVYTGTITFACSGLPSGATCVFSPPSISAVGCTVTNTVALSIYTTQSKAVGQSAIGGSGLGLWRVVTVATCLLMALALGLRRRKLRFRHVWMSLALLCVGSGLAACGNRGFTAGTPSGTYSVTVNVTGSTGTPATFTVPLIVQ